jgi:hypothetical protein
VRWAALIETLTVCNAVSLPMLLLASDCWMTIEGTKFDHRLKGYGVAGSKQADQGADGTGVRCLVTFSLMLQVPRHEAQSCPPG